MIASACSSCFFFQAEDGIRDVAVTGVQTCALPVSSEPPAAPAVKAVSPEMQAFERARQSVDKFFEQATNVVCTENVSQGLVGKNGKVDYREDSIFDYQLQSNPNSGSLKLVESRDTRKPPSGDSSRPLLTTNGFTAMLLAMHPTYESSYTFDPAGQESVDGG